MRFKNRQDSGSNDVERSNHPADSDHVFGNSSAWIHVLLGKLLFSGFAWMVLIGSIAGLAAVGMHLRGSGGVAPDGNVPRIWSDLVLYSSPFTTLVKNSHRDFLADYATFRSVWNEVSPHKPMMVKLERRAPDEPGLARASRTLPIDESNFAELRPLLDQIRNLILEGDGTGRGKLPQSDYDAEPAELELDRGRVLREPIQ